MRKKEKQKGKYQKPFSKSTALLKKESGRLFSQVWAVLEMLFSPFNPAFWGQFSKNTMEKITIFKSKVRISIELTTQMEVSDFFTFMAQK